MKPNKTPHSPIRTIIIGIMVSILLILTACNSGQTSEPLPEPTSTIETTTTLAAISLPTFTPFPLSAGPFLLIQTGNAAYEIFDFDLDQQYAVPLPDFDQRISLGGALSSSRHQLRLPLQDDQVQFYDLSTGAIQTIQLPQSGFDAAQTAALAQAALPDMGLTDEAALSAVEASFNDSISQVRWGLDDDYLFVVVPGSPTSTNLAKIEIATGEVEMLENLPGLVENVAIFRDQALLKKGLITEPGYWRDDQYAVINLTNGAIQTLELPSDVQNPILAWFDSDTLSITHQSQPIGGVDYSFLDLTEMTSKLVVEGQFSAVRPYQQGLLVFKPEPDSTQTIIERRDLTGDLLQETLLPEQCTLNQIVGDRILLNCETESLLMDPDLQTTSFSGPIFLLSASPDRNNWVLVERSGQVSLLDSTLANPQPLSLEGAPLEIRWLPNSNSFLYRTLGKLYLYDPATAQSTLILESDLLGDYANINAVWISLPN